MTCRSCQTPLITFLSLGALPLVNAFLTRSDQPEKRYDLSVGFCPSCFLVQLLSTVPPEEMFRDYVYTPASSVKTVEHFRATSHDLVRQFHLGRESRVIEIGSNDGTMLAHFREAGVRVFGIDPAKNLAAFANERGLTTIPEFFSRALAENLVGQGVRADLVFGANVLAHVPEINNFLDGIKTILMPRGAAVFEFPHLAGLLENKFDTIYHEHVFYCSLHALENVFARSGLAIFDVILIPAQGGSLQIYASHPGVYRTHERVDALRQEEERRGVARLETYRAIGKSAERLKHELLTLLRVLKGRGKRIAAYGAPAKGNVLLNYCGIGPDLVDFVVDKSEHKQGLYTPGTRFFVHPVERVYEQKPDYLLVLCWNLADEVLAQMADYRRMGGRCIIPIPRIRIV